jgi:hypothetical protein
LSSERSGRPRKNNFVHVLILNKENYSFKMEAVKNEKDERYKKGALFKDGRYIMVRHLYQGKFGRVDLVFDIEKNSKFISNSQQLWFIS